MTQDRERRRADVLAKATHVTRQRWDRLSDFGRLRDRLVRAGSPEVPIGRLSLHAFQGRLPESVHPVHLVLMHDTWSNAVIASIHEEFGEPEQLENLVASAINAFPMEYRHTFDRLTLNCFYGSDLDEERAFAVLCPVRHPRSNRVEYDLGRYGPKPLVETDFGGAQSIQQVRSKLGAWAGQHNCYGRAEDKPTGEKLEKTDRLLNGVPFERRIQDRELLSEVGASMRDYKPVLRIVRLLDAITDEDGGACYDLDDVARGLKRYGASTDGRRAWNKDRKEAFRRWIGEALRCLRKCHGYETQAQAAAAFGLMQQEIARFESRPDKVSKEALDKYMAQYGRDISDFDDWYGPWSPELAQELARTAENWESSTPTEKSHADTGLLVSKRRARRRILRSGTSTARK